MTDELKRGGDAAKAGADPTMEEILASIRRIIAEDGEGRDGDAEPATAPAVLDLTEMVADDGSVVSLQPHAGEDEGEPEALPAKPETPVLVPDPAPLENFMAPEPPVAPEAPGEAAAVPVTPAAPAPSRAVEEESVMPSAGPSQDQLVSEAIANQARNAFAQIADATRPAAPPRPVSADARTVEQVVEDLLRPMLKAWLDTNLPAIVERAVANELARIAGRSPAP
ncbi:DUF2497 domain-containing protein [Zavarzinia sp.]|uniref:DUF2497 domain-containing protein n=1 Tax=Zavarzinia sp. TaxID=2027920 RepID=UPI0035699CE9